MNLRDFSLILVVFLVPATRSDDEFKIIAGQRVTALEFPYQASIEVDGRHICGGAIVEDDYILTVAHCVYVFEGSSDYFERRLQVRVGSDRSGQGGELYDVSKVVIHEKYDETAENHQYDIALVRLSEHLTYTDRIRVIDLANTTPIDGKLAWVSGYGKYDGESSSRPLMAVELPIMSLSKCQNKLEGVTDDMICAGFRSGHKSACVGDSGGPLVVNGDLVGIFAWGKRCGRSGHPGAYINVAMYKDWIYTKTDHFDQ